MAGDALGSFHPAIAEWFRRRFPGGPTPAQALGWGSIAAGRHTLIAAPTGSGKTLAAFLVAVDRCVKAASAGEERRGTSVVYVSPLRALTVDVRENLERPLEEIAAIGDSLGSPVPRLHVAVRNGDTPPSARAAMLRTRPEILVTTPESLYLLVTAARGRELLSTVGTVIVDEIHALARDKRGAHLALTLERLERCVAGARPTRIGLSATQRPVETIARLLVGAGKGRELADGSPHCSVVDVGHRRRLDVDISLLPSELGAVATTEQMGEVVDLLAAQVAAHRTTLVFVNTRRMSERIAHLLAERLGENTVSAHHGSLSTERRLSVEARLRAGTLRAVVATASLELGIDIGPIDLVCQLGSPRSIATFLQRVGRADHRVSGVPKGRLYPLTRDELVECIALLAAVEQGSLDSVLPPVAPLDILAQQIVAECAASGAEGIAERELLEVVRRAAPYARLSEEDFESVLALASEGVETGRGRRGAHLHRDRVHGRLRARRGARLVASTSGGAIPDLADYKVLLEPDDTVVGTVNEDWAVEAMAGDVFLLGSSTWRIKRVEQGVVRVVDAEGSTPTLPFWLGEAPARTDELADAVSSLRALVEDALELAGAAQPDRGLGGRRDDRDGSAGRDGGGRLGGVEAAVDEVCRRARVDRRAAEEAVAYLAAARAQLGRLPTKSHLVLERFFDEADGMQLVVHSPYGARINRGLGLALRKRFCTTFNFELQAAAGDDSVLISLGPQHSFPLEDVTRFLTPGTVRDVLVQAVLPTPIFTSRWRWNLSRSLVSPRFRGSRRLPPAIQRMEADDLMAAIFPALAACQENVSGPIPVPDHPMVRQTLEDCFSEAIDLDGLVELVGRLRDGRVGFTCVDSSEPSLLAHEILNGRPFTYLDDAPLEERRSRAVPLRRGIPLEAGDLAAVDPLAVEEVRSEAAPDPRDAEELHDLLLTTVLCRPDPRWERFFLELARAGRAMTGHAEDPGRERGPIVAWCATERRADVEALLGEVHFEPDHEPPAALGPSTPEREEVCARAVGGWLEHSGPVLASELAETIPGLSPGDVGVALARLRATGSVLEVGDRWCSRHLAARIAARSRRAERRSQPAASLQDLMRFLLDWQHVSPASRLEGTAGLAEVVGQLQGIEAPVGAWEESILPARLSRYQPHLLDELSSQGAAAWGRVGLRTAGSAREGGRRAGSVPSRATPVTLARREDMAWLLAASRGPASPSRPATGAALEVLEALEQRGASFFGDICAVTGRLPDEVAEALWDGVARGLVTSDGFRAVRVLLAGRYRWTGHRRALPGRPRSSLSGTGRPPSPLPRAGGPLPLRRLADPARHVPPALAGGRWSVLEAASPGDFAPDELVEAVALQLLARWGIVFRDLAQRESLGVAWREVLWALRRLEARGVARGGRFVTGVAGEQYGLPEAVDALRARSRAPREGLTIRLSAADPLNLTGIVLPGPRVPATRGRSLLLLDGAVVGTEHADTPAPVRPTHRRYIAI